MIHHGDLFDVLPTLEAQSIDACVTDPPYGLGFMGKEWDTFKPGVTERNVVANTEIDSDNPNLKNRKRRPATSPSNVEYDRSLHGQRAFQDWTERWAREVFRVLKPGAHLLVCGAPRSYHRMASGLEDAGFEIRDCLSFLFGQGFPKSLNFGCKCRGKALQYSHADNQLRGVREASYSAASVAQTGEGSDLFASLQRDFEGRGVEAARAQGPGGMDAGERVILSREDERREQSELARRELHRAGEGLPDDSDAGPSESAGERLRLGAHRHRGEDSRPQVDGRRGSASQGPGQGEQRSAEPEDLQLPPGALDDGASGRGSRCERCGGLTEAQGFGSALKPGWEPIVIARKPFRGSLTDNYIKHGTGAINVDGCRLVTSDSTLRIGRAEMGYHGGNAPGDYQTGSDSGRWPANVAFDEDAARLLDDQAGDRPTGKGGGPSWGASAGVNEGWRRPAHEFYQSKPEAGYGDSGGASRFFYVAKPSRYERDMGCHELTPKQRDDSRKEGNPGGDNPRNRGLQPRGNHHPTVKPIELMRWLVRLVTPADGVVLDPFTGSGTTGCACAYELKRFVGIEREAEYVEIAQRRIAACVPLFTETA